MRTQGDEFSSIIRAIFTIRTKHYLVIPFSSAWKTIQINDVKTIAEIKSLEELWLDNNKITDISPLKDLPYLKKLATRGNPIADTKQIEDLKSAGVEVDF